MAFALKLRELAVQRLAFAEKQWQKAIEKGDLEGAKEWEKKVEKAEEKIKEAKAEVKEAKEEVKEEWGGVSRCSIANPNSRSPVILQPSLLG